jgi:hypothetical protein
MADDLDQMLQGADDQTPAPQANQGGQDSQVTPLDSQTPEEVEFNSLQGSTQDRIRELVRQKNEAQYQAQQPAYVPPAPLTPNNPEVQDAVRKLTEVGVADKSYVDKTVDERLNAIRWENEMSRLSTSYSGDKGTPQFDRTEVEDYIRSHSQYLNYAPEDVFKFKMHNPEDFAGSNTPRKSSSLRPTKQQAPENAMTVEYIAERTDSAKYPDAREWQDEHKAEIDKVLSTMS